MKKLENCKTITDSSLASYLETCKKYQQNKDENTLKTINNFINNVINKDKKYYSKVSKFTFTHKLTKNDVVLFLGGGLKWANLYQKKLIK